MIFITVLKPSWFIATLEKMYLSLKSIDTKYSSIRKLTMQTNRNGRMVRIDIRVLEVIF